MSRFTFPFVKVLALAALCACGTKTSDDPPTDAPPTNESTDACADVDCGPGQCVASLGEAACTCPAGYVAAGASCKRDVREGDDHGDTLAAATAVAPGEWCTAQLDLEADVDMFAFPVKAGRIYEFWCQPTAFASYNSACRVTLLGADGAALTDAKWSDGTHGYLSGVLATQDGTLYARVDRNPVSSLFGRGYMFRLTDLGTDDYANTAAAATVVAAGTTVSGRLELLGDVDVFALDATEGRSYRLSCTGEWTHCRMRLTNPQGEVQATSSGDWLGRVSTLELTGAPAGRYTVEVVGLAGVLFSSGVGGYTYSYVELTP